MRLWRELQAGIALEEEAPETHAPPSSAELRLRTTSTLLQQGGSVLAAPRRDDVMMRPRHCDCTGDSVLTELSRDALRVSRLVDEQTQVAPDGSPLPAGSPLPPASRSMAGSSTAVGSFAATGFAVGFFTATGFPRL